MFVQIRFVLRGRRCTSTNNLSAAAAAAAFAVDVCDRQATSAVVRYDGV